MTSKRGSTEGKSIDPVGCGSGWLFRVNRYRDRARYCSIEQMFPNVEGTNGGVGVAKFGSNIIVVVQLIEHIGTFGFTFQPEVYGLMNRHCSHSFSVVDSDSTENVEVRSILKYGS